MHIQTNRIPSFPLQNKRTSEPIYAEPSKVANPVLPPTAGTSSSSSSSASSNSNNLHFQEYEGVTFRNPKQLTGQSCSSPKLDGQQRKSDHPNTQQHHSQPPPVTTSGQAAIQDDEKSRHSDTELFKDVELRSSSEDEPDNRPSRKYHSKSFSLSENRIAAAGSNLFHQNRELWEKRAELQSQQCLTTPRILSRNRIAPDLVMDLPFQVVGGVICTKDPSLIRNSRESLDGCVDAEDLTSAERFAAPNQCTLKKNERFSSESYETKKEVKLDFHKSSVIDKPKAEVRPQEITNGNGLTAEDSQQVVLEDILHIDEDGSVVKEPQLHKSPIPARNTKKFVTQFADLHLTGGCMTADPSANGTTTATVLPTSGGSGPLLQQQTSLSSFKPQVKVKPQLLKKPMVLPPGTPEMGRRHQD